ncbi:MAG: hypothetical protein M3R00_00975 [Pseudomonadota bacterium]|nr:hypothetical protein [Pseudomonadota bacterium]
MQKRLVDLIIVILAVWLMPSVVLAQSGTVNDINSMLANIAQSVPGVVQLTFGACYVVGVFEVMRAIYKLKRYAQGTSMMSQEASLAKPVVTLFIGVGCIYLPTLMGSILTTLWATDSVIAYPEATSDPWIAVTKPLILVLRAFGLISIVRGWLQLAKMGGEGATQPGTVPKAVMHILGGICAWNIVGLWNVIQNTLGISE